MIMSEDQKRQLNQQLWNIANTLRGKMGADEFRDYILGFIFYKYLSEKMELYANGILKEDKINYLDISEATKQGQEYLEAIKEESLEKLGYYLKPSELFKQVAKRGNGNGKDQSNFIIEDIQKILINIQNSTMGTDSEEDFDHLFEDMDLNSTKLGKSAEQRNEVIAKVLSHLDKIDFKLEQSKIDVLGVEGVIRNTHLHPVDVPRRHGTDHRRCAGWLIHSDLRLRRRGRYHPRVLGR
jgi:type I restriction enzyme M protein